MNQLIILTVIFLKIFAPEINPMIIPSDIVLNQMLSEGHEKSITPMMALDLVKERYAANFDKIYEKNSEDKYFYQLADADYYLEYESELDPANDYLIHLYEFVVDDPETGVGHTVTYGWYSVGKKSGRITDQTQ
jgi:hypothetical protein